MTAINYDVPDDLHRRVKVAAAMKGVTLKAYFLDALTAAVDADDAKNRKA